VSNRKRNAAIVGGLLLLALIGSSSASAAEPKRDPKKRNIHAPPGWEPDPDAPPPKVPTVPTVPTGPGKPKPTKPKGPQVQPLTPDGPDDPDEPIRVDPIVPDEPIDPDEPTPAKVDDIIKTYPTPATFFQVIYGNEFLGNQGIVARLMRSALFLAARAQGMSVDEANAWAAPRANDAQNRIKVTKDIACVPINDVRFGTYAFPKDQVIPGPQGRGIRLLPMNADDASRIRQGMTMVRNVRLSSPGAPSSTSSEGVESEFQSLELLWLPGYDLDVLFTSNGETWTMGGEWSDGSSKIHPPPLIYGLGVTDYSDAGLGVWGCAPNTAEIS